MTKIPKLLFIYNHYIIYHSKDHIYLFFRDIEVSNEWGIILNNLENNGILSVHSVQGTPVPNIFMPPLYPFFYTQLKCSLII